MMKELVFVYGSLKRGFHNSSLLRESKFIATAITANAEFRMGNVGAYPEVTRTNTDAAGFIRGELYHCDQKAMDKLDELEANGQYYRREMVPIKRLEPDDADPVLAWIYLWLENEYPIVKPADHSNGHPIYEWWLALR